jgi:hypothetical protein
MQTDGTGVIKNRFDISRGGNVLVLASGVFRTGEP